MVAGVNKSRKSNINILSRNKKINEIKKRIVRLRNERNDLLDSFNNIDSEIEKNNNLLNENKHISFELNEKLSSINILVERKKYQIETLSKRYLELKESLNESLEDEDFKDIEKIKSDLEVVRKKVNNLNEEINIKNNLINDLSNEIFKNKNSIEINKSDLNILGSKINEDQNSLVNLEENIKLNQKLKSSLEKTLEDLEEEINFSKNKIKSSKDNLQKLKENKLKVSKEIEEKKKSNHELLSLSKKIENDLNEYSMKIVKFNYKLEAISKDLKNLEDEIRPFISKPLEKLKENRYNDKDFSVKKEDLFYLQKKLGNVGFFEENSKENYKKINDEFEFLDRQKVDLEESKKDIEKMIKKLEDETKDEFIKNFNIIDEKFQRIFKELFMGGNAKLSLDSNDLLDAGIDISACPPGKSTKNISLLSGGEKSLTAVALLFAIFETNPAPFSLLDEIDAAMDESNIKRYIDYLKSLSNNTQFIMITHRQTTMQLAEKIHGVTIGDGGISKIYSIDFEEKN